MDLFNGIQMLAVSKALDVSKSLLIVLDDGLRVKHLNQQAKKIFDWKNNKEILNKSLLNLCKKSKLPALLDRKGNLLTNEATTIHGHIIQWQQLRETTKDQGSSLLIGQDVTDKCKLKSRVRKLIADLEEKESHEEEIYQNLETVSKEITGQKFEARLEPEQYVSQVRDYLENIIAEMPCFVYWKDTRFRYLGCNDKLIKDLGFKSKKELIGKTDYDFWWDTEIVDSWRKVDKEVISTGRPKLNVEDRVIDKKGKFVLLLTNKMPLFDKNKNVIGLIAISVDITKKKALEEKLNSLIKKLTFDVNIKQSEQNQIYKVLKDISREITGENINLTEEPSVHRYVSHLRDYYESIIDEMPCVVFWKDTNFRYLGCNHISLDMVGLTRKEFIGKTDYDIGWETWRADEVRKIDEEIIKTGLPKLNIEETIVKKNGQHVYLIGNKMPLFNDKREVIGIIGISVDITERKRMEDELKTAKEAAEKALKTEKELQKTKYQLEGAKLISGSIAHEIRTPLATIKSGIEGIEITFSKLMDINQLASDKNLAIETITDYEIEGAKKAIKSISRKVDQSNVIINMLLTKLQSINFEFSEFALCSVSQCIKNSIQEFILPDNMINKMSFKEDNDFKFVGNNILISHVIMNLIKNAVFYILKAGKGEISIWLEQHKKYNEIHFKDTGTGISPQVLPRIFDSFFTTESSTGTGVGLAFCKMVMQSHKGKIECVSKEGEYTEFILSFPHPKLDKDQPGV